MEQLDATQMKTMIDLVAYTLIAALLRALHAEFREFRKTKMLIQSVRGNAEQVDKMLGPEAAATSIAVASIAEVQAQGYQTSAADYKRAIDAARSLVAQKLKEQKDGNAFTGS